MAKVEKKNVPDRSSKANEAPKKNSVASSSNGKAITRFFGNFLKSERYKPNQGFTARVATASALGLVIAAGLIRFSQTLSAVTVPNWVSQPGSRLGIPFLLAAFFGWLVFRLINQPDFSEFLIATESEMKKVSWTTWADLKRAASVVLVTVVLMTMYLWLVDQVWATLLKWIGVLRI